jgi:hypothetical protein
MQAVDCMFGFTAFGSNTADRLFLEYAPDGTAADKLVKRVRTHGFVAMFDRKCSEGKAFDPSNYLSLSVYLDACRALSERQGTNVRFFFVIGGNEPPWTMIEVDRFTGERTGSPVEIRASRSDPRNPEWETVWRELGLTKEREAALAWARRNPPLRAVA